MSDLRTCTGVSTGSSLAECLAVGRRTACRSAQQRVRPGGRARIRQDYGRLCACRATLTLTRFDTMCSRRMGKMALRSSRRTETWPARGVATRASRQVSPSANPFAVLASLSDRPGPQSTSVGSWQRALWPAVGTGQSRLQMSCPTEKSVRAYCALASGMRRTWWHGHLPKRPSSIRLAELDGRVPLEDVHFL